LWQQNTYQFYEEGFGDPLKVHREIADLFRDRNASPQEVENRVRQHIMAALDSFLSTMEEACHPSSASPHLLS